jgi:hypothetical protein
MVKEGASAPDGLPKSGRAWKKKQTVRASTQKRQGFLKVLNKSFEEREELRKKKQQMLETERQMKEEKRQKILEEKAKREEKQKRRMENEYKNSVYQMIKPEKLKTMSKKQLRAVRKTSMNQNGQVELVNPWEKK